MKYLLLLIAPALAALTFTGCGPDNTCINDQPHQWGKYSEVVPTKHGWNYQPAYQTQTCNVCGKARTKTVECR